MSGRYQVLSAYVRSEVASFDEARSEVHRRDDVGEGSRSDYWLVRDRETGLIYLIDPSETPTPDSRRADLVDHAKETLLWPYRGASDE